MKTQLWYTFGPPPLQKFISVFNHRLETSFSICVSDGVRWPKEIIVLAEVHFLVPNKRSHLWSAAQSRVRASPVAQKVKNLQATWEAQVQPLGQKDPLEKGMATPSSSLAWRIPGTEESGGLWSMGSQSQTRLSDEHLHFCTFQPRVTRWCRLPASPYFESEFWLCSWKIRSFESVGLNSLWWFSRSDSEASYL